MLREMLKAAAKYCFVAYIGFQLGSNHTAELRKRYSAISECIIENYSPEFKKMASGILARIEDKALEKIVSYELEKGFRNMQNYQGKDRQNYSGKNKKAKKNEENKIEDKTGENKVKENKTEENRVKENETEEKIEDNKIKENKIDYQLFLKQ